MRCHRCEIETGYTGIKVLMRIEMWMMMMMHCCCGSRSVMRRMVRVVVVVSYGGEKTALVPLVETVIHHRSAQGCGHARSRTPNTRIMLNAAGLAL